MFDYIDVLLNRLDQLEAKNKQQDVKVAELEAKVEGHESKINSQQIEIDQLNTKNWVLEEKLYQISQRTSSKQVASRKPSSCLDLLDLGHTLTGFYDVLPVGSSQIASIYCDFALQPTEADFETRVGFVDIKSSPVHFFVTGTSICNTGTMPFDKEYLNVGGGMNLTCGVFTAPVAGIYAFSFKGTGYASGYSYSIGRAYAGYVVVYLQRNSVNVARGLTNIDGASADTWTTVYVHGTFKLDKGDNITIYHADGTIFSDISNDSQFTGSLVEEHLVIIS